MGGLCGRTLISCLRLLTDCRVVGRRMTPQVSTRPVDDAGSRACTPGRGSPGDGFVLTGHQRHRFPRRGEAISLPAWMRVGRVLSSQCGRESMRSTARARSGAASSTKTAPRPAFEAGPLSQVA